MKLVSKYNRLVAGILAAQVIFFLFLGSWGGFFRGFSFLPFLVILCVLKRNWSGLGICVISGFLLDIFSFATFGSFLFKTSFLFFIAGLWLEFFSGLSLYILLTFLAVVETFLDRFTVFLLTWGKEPLFQRFPFLTLFLNLVAGYLLIFFSMGESGMEER